MNYIKTTEFAKLIDQKPVTVRGWVQRGIIQPAYTTPTGRHMFTKEQAADILSKKGSHPRSTHVDPEDNAD